MNKIAFLTTIYPIDDIYVTDFFESLIGQTNSNFDVIIVNDGFSALGKLKNKYNNLNIIELPAADNIAKNRESLVKYAISSGYNYAIFGDIDDYFDSNRIEVSKSLLQSCDIVVNDLTSFSSKNVLVEKFISNRVENHTEIPLNFIMDKNIFGLSNTAIKLKGLLSEHISFPSKLIAVDWFFFSNLLLNNKKAIFTNETLTYYRQHDGNTAGIGTINANTIVRAIKVKLIHYSFMKENNSEYQILYEQTHKLTDWLSKKENVAEYVQINLKNLPVPLWWETTKLGNISELNA